MFAAWTLADTKGRTAAALAQPSRLRPKCNQFVKRGADDGGVQLNQGRQQIATQGQQPQEAEQRAAKVSAKRSRIASVKNDARDGDHPVRRSPLHDGVRIEGYTDSTGTQAVDQKLRRIVPSR